MKTFQLIITASAWILLPSCSLVGLRTTKEFSRETRLAYSRGFNAAKAAAARASYLQQQEDLEKPQPKANRYKIRVPKYTAADGVNFLSHNKNIQIVNQ
ncbi:hypothetical protein N9891_00120 [bacterium]|nr:hypothetical protein [bacterium]